jgi:hypothetical protein
MATPKQQKLIKLFIDNLSSKGSTKTLGEMMIEAGYSETQSTNPHEIFGSETVKEGLSDVVKQIDKERARIMQELTLKDLSEEKYKDLVDSMDKLTKNSQLLGGGDTERTKIVIVPSEISNKNNLNGTNE